MRQNQKYFFLTLFAGVSVLVFFILRPYLGAIFFGAVLAVVFSPIHRYFDKKMKGHTTIAALLTVLLVVLLVLVPASAIGTQLVLEARQAYMGLEAGVGINAVIDAVASKIEVVVPQLTFSSVDVDSYARGALDWLLAHLGSLFSGVATAFLNLVLGLFSLFFCLKNGKEIRNRFAILSPMPKGVDDELLGKLETAASSTIKGTLIVAVIQGLVAGFGFFIFGLPQPILWGLVAALAALIPAVGTGLVVIPASIYLFIAGSTFAGVGNLVWGLLIVGTLDNYLRPKLMEKGVDAHPFIVLLSILGGVSFFGPIGFIAGPLVISLLFALLDMYPKIISSSK